MKRAQHGPRVEPRDAWSQGPSIGLTQTYFGRVAANRLTTELRNRPQTSEFRLSNATVCDLRAASCWSDGWQKRQQVNNVALANQPPAGAAPPAGGTQYSISRPKGGSYQISDRTGTSWPDRVLDILLGQ